MYGSRRVARNLGAIKVKILYLRGGQSKESSLGKHFSFPFLLATPWSPPRTLEGLLELTRRPSRALNLDTCCFRNPDLQKYKDTNRCDPVGDVSPGHRHEKLWFFWGWGPGLSLSDPLYSTQEIIHIWQMRIDLWHGLMPPKLFSRQSYCQISPQFITFSINSFLSTNNHMSSKWKLNANFREHKKDYHFHDEIYTNMLST